MFRLVDEGYGLMIWLNYKGIKGDIWVQVENSSLKTENIEKQTLSPRNSY
jgi:hypothetical protein